MSGEVLTLAIKSRPIVLLAHARSVVIGSDAGEWFAVGASGELHALPSTGPFGAAVVDHTGTITVACWEPSVKQRGATSADDDRWSEVMLGAAPLALAVTERGVVAGDTEGGLALVPTSSRIAVQELTAAEPIVELCALGDALVALGATGALDVTTWPFREAPLATVDTSAIGRPYAVFPGTRVGTAIVAGKTGFAVLAITRGEAALLSVVADASAIRGSVTFRDRDRACVYTDTGEAWIVDGTLARVTRIRLPAMVVTGAAANPDGTVMLWTADGELHLVGHDGAVRRIAEYDVVLAGPDPDRASGFIAVHWNAASGARVSRGRAAWT